MSTDPSSVPSTPGGPVSPVSAGSPGIPVSPVSASSPGAPEALAPSRSGRGASLRAHLQPHPPTPPAPSGSRAGRNLKLAIPTAVILLALVALSVAFRIEIFVILVAIALCIAIWEVAGAFLNRGIRIAVIPLMAGVVAMVAATWWGGLLAGFGAYIATAFVHGLWIGCRELIATRRSRDAAPSSGDTAASSPLPASDAKTPARSGRDAGAGAFAAAWIGLLGTFAVALAGTEAAAAHIAVLILMPVANDTGGWAAGVLFGKHPLAPKISPKKSWEGFAGSIILALVFAFPLMGLWLGHPWWVCVLIAVVAVVCCTGGDLAESMLKRELGVKDMGSIFPGHGGMLDRLDSILMWAPFCYLIVAWAGGIL
ncbi:phosphatidate cytidylyltransferase [Actinobaculum suis]|uniref:Phosphatidate cytidylyltransferase n=1 Tax=Actinobaculum suis TaxID=1657 RepID=A0A1G6ZH87_9ACTO|nr:phosphatidate cytidylyltransferase [Actinobaculum suis]